ncbi:Hsp20/alpha crystallin family protein [candidate division KSB1 bacterium]|nr:Hsp20/alpha crystallin family protein [candidate division KSB1 bacterium]
MAILRWRPTHYIPSIQREMNRLFDEFMGQDVEEGERYSRKWSPEVDIVEMENEIVLTAELPGVSKSDIKISVQDGELTLSGKKDVPENEKSDCYHCSERYYGPFERKFTLSTIIDSTKINAEFKNGVLKVRLPKAEAAKPTQIEIK